MYRILRSTVIALAVAAVGLVPVSTALSAEVFPDDSRERAYSEVTTPSEPAGSVSAPRSTEAESVHWSVIASGGGQVAAGGLRLGGTIGQTFAGTVTVGGHQLISGFWQNFDGVLVHCCLPPTVGDVDQSGSVDITDLQVMIDHQFLTLAPLVCDEEGDVDFSLAIDITDLQVMIDYQYISLSEFPPCP